MAILCSYCGATLERDDARFCQNCGKSVSPHAQPASVPMYSDPPTTRLDGKPASQNRPVQRAQVVKRPEREQPPAQEQTVQPLHQDRAAVDEQIARQPERQKPELRAQIEKAAGESPTSPRVEIVQSEVQANAALPAQREMAPEQDRPALREQIAVQPPARPERERYSDEKASRNKQKSIVWPDPITHVSVTGQPQELAQVEPEQEKTSLAPPPQVASAGRELHVKVWDQNTVAVPTHLPAEAPKNAPAEPEAQVLDELPTTPHPQAPIEVANLEKAGQSIEDRPTNFLHAPSAQASVADQQERDRAAEQPSALHDIGQLDTMHELPSSQTATAQAPSTAAVRESSSPPVRSEPVEPGKQRQQVHQQREQAAQPEAPVIMRPIPARFSEFQDRIPQLRGALFTASPQIDQGPRHIPVVPLAIALLIVLIVSISSWIIIAQPFSVPAITQPQVSFRDSNLGLSLQYPNGWMYQKRAAVSSVQFADSSHTDQVTLVVVPASNGTIAADLQKQATQLGVTGAKSGAPLSFAGTSWQSLQGSVQQSGATYTCTIFMTAHANHRVMLTQLAPQSIYAAEENAVFKPLRQSLQFI